MMTLGALPSGSLALAMPEIWLACSACLILLMRRLLSAPAAAASPPR